MADIRIKDLAVTAGSSASDDYLAVDGSTNGTRKLSAYSPTFGGNLTASGNLTVSGYGQINGLSNNSSDFRVSHSNTNYAFDVSTKSTGASVIQLYNSNGTTGVSLSSTASATNTIAGNLAVSGTGTSSFAGNVAVTGTGTNYTAIDTGSFAKFGNDQTSANLQVGSNSGVGAILQGAAGGSVSYPLVAQPYGGNVLIGTTTDGGQKLQVSGTAAISGGIVGTTTNDSAAAGIVGQYVSASVGYGARAANTDAVIRNVTSISLTAGDWDVDGFVSFEGAGTTATIVAAGVSASSATLDDPQFGQTRISVSGVSGNVGVQTTGTRRFSIASTTTIYLTCRAFFSAGTVDTYGEIRARRVR